MSLTITSPIETNEGLVVENAYARLAVVDNIDGNKVEGRIEVYASKVSFESSKSPIYSPSINNGFGFPYDRTGMGGDILDLAHDYMVNILASQGITAIKTL